MNNPSYVVSQFFIKKKKKITRDEKTEEQDINETNQNESWINLFYSEISDF